jgi:hypothetical protein
VGDTKIVFQHALIVAEGSVVVRKIKEPAEHSMCGSRL